MNVVYVTGVPNEFFRMLEDLVKGPIFGHMWLMICKRFGTSFVMVKIGRTFTSRNSMREGSATTVPQGICKRFGASVGRTWAWFDFVGARTTVSSCGRTKLFVVGQLVQHAHGVNMYGGCFS